MNKQIKIFYAEDKIVFRKTIVQILEGYNIRTIGEAENGLQLVNLFKTASPDVVLLDLEMPVMDGNRAMDILLHDQPDLKIIVLSLHSGKELIDNYIARGAKGYIPKDMMSDFRLVADAIREVANGGYFVRYPKEPGIAFSKQQIRIIPKICQGKTNKEIAIDLGIAEREVEKQRQKIYEKTNSSNAASFFKFAFRRGLDFLG